jgi:hypothetical protein
MSRFWSERPYLEKPITKGAGGEAQGVGPEFKSQYLKSKISCQVIVKCVIIWKLTRTANLKQLILTIDWILDQLKETL